MVLRPSGNRDYVHGFVKVMAILDDFKLRFMNNIEIYTVTHIRTPIMGWMAIAHIPEYVFFDHGTYRDNTEK